MSSSGNESRRGGEARPAYCEDADNDGNVADDAPRISAASIPPSSPTKERPNTRKSRRSPSSPVARSDESVSSDDSGVETVPHRSLKPSGRPRDPLKAQKRVSYEKRPPTRHSNTAPTVPGSSRSRKSGNFEEAAYYGREPEPVQIPAVSRPRAGTVASHPHRHSSYSGSRPPQASARYQHMQPPIVTGPPAGSFPPPPWAMSPAPPPPPIYPQHVAPPPMQEYFPVSRSLSSRFDSNRPLSAMAHRTSRYGEDSEQENRGLIIRRPSKSKKREDEDRMRMPPPQRPSSAMPLAIRPSPFAPPPQQTQRSSRLYDDNPFQVDLNSPYADLSPVPYDYSMPSPRATRRPSMSTHAISYDHGAYRTEVAASGSASRRNSQYGGVALSNAFDEKMRFASDYQVDDAPGVQLTAEVLRKATKGKNGGSSRSTRSSASRDESDYRQSATTRTTRSSVEDDVTIRVKGNATLKLGGAEVYCPEGAEINLSRNGGGGGGGSGGSDHSSYIDADERRTRAERPSTRTRTASSQAGSYSRTTPYNRYSGTYDQAYSYHPPPLPPPPVTGGHYAPSSYGQNQPYF